MPDGAPERAVRARTARTRLRDGDLEGKSDENREAAKERGKDQEASAHRFANATAAGPGKTPFGAR